MKVPTLFQSKAEEYVYHQWLLLFSIPLLVMGCNESGVVEPEEMPEVVMTEPEPRAESFSPGSSMTVYFNKKMDPSSITSTSFTLMQGNTAVLGTVSASDSTATFNPLGTLPGDAPFTATVTSDVKDLSGNQLMQAHSWSFRTAAGQELPGDDENDDNTDSTPPVIQSVDPADHDVDVPVERVIAASFSEEMNPSTLNGETFMLRYGTTTVSGRVVYEENRDLTAHFIPSEELPPGNTFTATMAAEVEDVSGNPMGESFNWSFTTQETADETPPEIIETHPEGREGDVDTDEAITVTFNEEMAPSSINESTFTLQYEWIFGSREVSGTIEYEDNTAIFIPDDDLEEDRIFTAAISAEVQDAAGNSLGEDYEWNFRTEDD